MTSTRPHPWLTNDQGSTLIAVLMLMMVVAAMAGGSVQVARHSNDLTSVDRERLQTVEAAEAGVNDAIRRIEDGYGCDVAVSDFSDLSDQDRVVGRYRTRIDPEAGTTCGQTTRRTIYAWGYSPTGGTRAMRHLEVQVELVPQEGFPYTLFAEGDYGADAGKVMVKNHGNAHGMIYAEVLDSSKNDFEAEHIVTPDSIVTKNTGLFSGTLWAGGNITLGDGNNVGGSVLASGTRSGTAGDITLNNGYVSGHARAKGAITGSGNVQGSVSAGDTSVPAPPMLAKPTYDWSSPTGARATYLAAGVTPVELTASGLTGRLITDNNANNLKGVYYNNSGPSSTITLPNNAKVAGNLTIISSGSVVLPNNLTTIGGPWTVVIVAQSTAATAIDDSNQDFTSDATNIDLLLFADGGVNFDKKVDPPIKGAIYANQIDAKSGFDITKSTVLATLTPPGFDWDFSSSATYTIVPTLWREVAPGTPPASVP